MLMCIGFLKGNNAVVLGNNPGTHASELLHLGVCNLNLGCLKLGNYGGFHRKFEQDLRDISLGAMDLFPDCPGDDGG